MKNKSVLLEMFKIYGYSDKDWMGFKITKKNGISYHHIFEKRNGGEETVDNGAILTKNSHALLNRLEINNYDLYCKWNLLFMEINETKKPLDDYLIGKIGHLKRETKEFFISLNNTFEKSITL